MSLSFFRLLYMFVMVSVVIVLMAAVFLLMLAVFVLTTDSISSSLVMISSS